jgi:serine/threonine protein phosphatase PrpC
VRGETLKLGIGVVSAIGQRRRNEDFAAAARPDHSDVRRFGHAMALADGIGGNPGGREAAEIAVRGFLDGYYERPESWGVRRAAASVLDSLNSWIHTIGQTDAALASMGCTFTGLILRGRTAHLLHVGDSRLYRFSAGRLVQLTEDHALRQPGLTNVLYRALGLEPGLRLDYAAHPFALHDRFLLCSDGVHGALAERDIAGILARAHGPQETAAELVEAALARGSSDNATALVADVLALPQADQAGLSLALESLPVLPLPKPGDVVDGFKLLKSISAGRHASLFLASDQHEGGQVVLKFPRPRAVADDVFRAAFLREIWVSAQVRSPLIGRTLELAPGRQSRLYGVMPFYEGETLEQRLNRAPPVGLEEGRLYGMRLCRALATLHRAGIVHRDIKPENVILGADGAFHLIDLGVVRVPGLEDLTGPDIPGTPSFMAPELFDGRSGDEQSDIYAVGATLFRAFTRQYPHGEIEPFTHPRFDKPRSLLRERPDLPAWLEHVLGQALATKPEERFADATEMMIALEGVPIAASMAFQRRPFYQRDPVRFWQIVSAVLAVGLLLALR